MRKLKLLAATLAMTLAFATPAFADGVFGDTNLVLGGGTIINDSSFRFTLNEGDTTNIDRTDNSINTTTNTTIIFTGPDPVPAD
jgi:hypothetical protein